MPATLACPKCQTPWPMDMTTLAELQACPGCMRYVRVTPFPALLSDEIRASHPEKIVIEGEASCFYHPDKRAVIPCNSCGRFLCALCDVALGDRHLCPGCLETGRSKGKLTELETGRTLWDSMALTLAFFPLVCIWPSLLFAPIALILAIYAWRKPSSIVRRSKWRLWVAIVASLLQIVGWIIFFVVMATGSGAKFKL
jgi:hypothetical protein